MKDNLPEIGIKGRKERKGGALGWLRGLGSGAGSSSAGSAGLSALIAGHMGAIIGTTVIAACLGAGYLANHKAPASVTAPAAPGTAKAQQAAEYVPAIQRSLAANGGSSLSMFTDKNKGSGLSLQETAAGAKKAAEEAAKNKSEAAAESKDDAANPQDAQSAADGTMAGLQGGAGASSLTSSLDGGGSGKFAGMSGKSGQGAMGSKMAMSNSIGSGFKAMSGFQERKGKLLAMKGVARPVVTAGQGAHAAHGFGGSKTWNQARALRAMQQTYRTSNGVDNARHTEDKAWGEGTTGGDAGAGMGEGNGDDNGIVTSPSIDNPSGPSSTPANPTIPDTPVDTSCIGKCGPAYTTDCINACAVDATPWKDMANWCNGLILAACAGAIYGGGLVTSGTAALGIATAALATATAALVGVAVTSTAVAAATAAIAAAKATIASGEAYCTLAGIAGAAAAVLAVLLETTYHQGWMAAIYGVGAGLSIAAAIAAHAPGGVGTVLGVPAGWVAGAAAVASLIAGTLGGK